MNSIYSFDQELVIDPAGVCKRWKTYYTAKQPPCPFLPDLDVPVLDALRPQMTPCLTRRLFPISPPLTGLMPGWILVLTEYGGHVGYYSGEAGQSRAGDEDPWWAWNRVLDWINQPIHYKLLWDESLGPDVCLGPATNVCSKSSHSKVV